MTKRLWLLTCLAAVLVANLPVHGVTVVGLVVAHRKGQSFITFRETGQSGITYRVFRSPQPITSVQNLAPIAVLEPGSGTSKYTGRNFIIEDLGAPLPSGSGLLVFTPDWSGSFYYAVTTSLDASLVPGVNVTSSPVPETRLDVPGAVQIAATYPDPYGNPLTEYYAWEDFTTWDPGWGYYGHRFNVVTEPKLQAGVTYPLTVVLHSAGDSGYKEPEWYFTAARPIQGVFIHPRDIGFLNGMADPYTGSGRWYSMWFGYSRPSTPRISENITERRIIRYVKLVQADPRYQVDPDRTYAFGMSMGGGGSMHLVSHYPHVFAAAAAVIGPVDTQAAARDFWDQTNPPVNSVDGPRLFDWWNMAYLLPSSRFPVPPIIHTFRKDDNQVNAANYPRVLQLTEASRSFTFAQWALGGHNPFHYGQPGQLGFNRYRRTEAYPVFTNAGNSTPFESQEGQRNLYLNWTNSLHDMMAGSADDLVDTATAFRVSLKSLQGDTTAQVTIRNAQKFVLMPGDTVTWNNVSHGTGAVIQSGTAVADAAGLVTLNLSILAVANRLSLDCAACGAVAHQRLLTNIYLPDINPLPVGTIDQTQKTVTVRVPGSTNVSALAAVVTHTGSAVTPASGTKVDFSSPVIYRVQASDGSQQAYTVTVVRGTSTTPPPSAPTNLRLIQ